MRMTINRKNILKYAQWYDRDYKEKEKNTENRIKSLLKKHRYMTRQNLIDIGDWKAPRARRHYSSRQNYNHRVMKISQFSFSTRDEKVRIESLLGQKGGLRGVGYPMASTILHFVFPNRYPIMDFRVIRFLYGKEPSTYTYNFGFWNDYCNRIRNIAKKYNLCIRMVEKALWKYDELKFGKKKTCK